MLPLVSPWAPRFLPMFGLAIAITLGFLVSSFGMQAGAAESISKEQSDFFEANIRPLLIDQCYECHSRESGESAGELRLDSARAVLQGGANGPALVAGKPEQSLILRAINYRDNDLQMPPSGKLDDDAIAAIRRWIEMGAPDPRQEVEGVVDKSESPLDRDPSSHWAFRVPTPASLEDQPDPTSRDLLDAIAHRRAESKGLQVAPEANREALIRRLYYDLTGLTPTAEQIARFVKSDRPDAYARLVDSLLATPDFGERFGRYWMDVSRYADTVGYALAGRPRRFEGSHRFRDWAIHAFASDMPYDEMLRHQLAGDRTDPENQDGNLDAMGFLTLGRKFLNPLDTIDDRIDVISRGLLGLTVTCARCHDHKFDPIPTSDYYSMAGIIFSSTQPDEGPSPLMLVDKDNPVDSPVLIRGQPGNRGPIAPRQFLTALRDGDDSRFSDGSGRWELAQEIASPENPLTARVMVNRLWHHLIGKPLVDSPSDFGYRTEPPAIPEVLDDLAVEFAQHWSTKKLVRRIVLTRIYRQTAETSDMARELDPDNEYLARANRRRRDFESLRDSTLHVAGALDRSLGGEAVEITLDTPSPRRTVYAMIDRQNLPALFRTFDFASPDTHSPARYFTTVPQQALHLLNNRKTLDLARRTAEAIRREVGSEQPNALAMAAFRRVLGREPSEAEQSMVVQFLSQPASPPEPVIDPRSLWTYGTATKADDGRPIDFQHFPVFNQNNTWQASDEFPSEGPLGYAHLGKEAGHTARDLNTLVVRRFTAPFTGRFTLRGTMGHREKQGDGYEASIWVGDRRIFRERQMSSNRPYGGLAGEIEQGQTIDLVAAAGESDSFDSFFWDAKINLAAGDGRVVATDSTKHFSGPYNHENDQPLDRLSQLAQTLLMSNEFAFVD